ncbi:MAG: PAS domain-containing sensor histidine kinase [Actinomycetota bacterium]|nr:PAS domain-containing sensor histidine kinase [Actinomycetota bacterium]
MPAGNDIPWRDRRLWVVLGVILVAYVARLAVEVEVTRAHAPVPGLPDFTTLGVFLAPVLYAAVTLGPTGAVASTAWVAALSVPRDLAFLHGGDPVAVWAESTQVAALCIVALVVGRLVTAERAARDRADQARRAHLAAEARYRALFESSGSPAVLVDRHGTVLEANAAACAVSGSRPTTLAAMVGSEQARRCLDRFVADAPVEGSGDAVVIGRGDRRQFRLLATDMGSSDVEGLVQVVLTDVTVETVRRREAESFAAAVVGAQEEERRRLAQELHDGPLQSLVHLVRCLDDVVGSGSVPVSPVGPGSAMVSGSGSGFDDLRPTALGLVDELRRIARGLRPSVLDDLGLVAAVRRLLDEVAERSGIEATLGVTGTERRLPAQIELALYRVSQEAVTNAERHGRPRRIAVGIGFEPGRAHLLVSDDGSGFDPEATAGDGRPASLGMRGMSERVQLAGGRLTVHSSHGSGTTVEAVVPVAPLDQRHGAPS